jgi:hypothetical protein
MWRHGSRSHSPSPQGVADELELGVVIDVLFGPAVRMVLYVRFGVGASIWGIRTKRIRTGARARSPCT